jgi:allantoin racemase
VIQAGYGEHGREGLQELLNVPVVDITDAAASTAMFLGHAYSVVTTLDRTVPLIEDRLKLSGLWDRCASVRASGWRCWNWSRPTAGRGSHRRAGRTGRVRTRPK